MLARPAPEVAPGLIGWEIHSVVDGRRTVVEIVEVEAYMESDPASHTHRGRTHRNRSMFETAGTLYVYRSYGIHWCMNVVTGVAGEGSGVLIRAGRPLVGLAEMRRRRGRADGLTDGPGKLTQALGVTGVHDGLDLLDDGEIRLIPGVTRSSVATPRIGVSRGVDTLWRWVADPSVTSPDQARSADD